MVSTPKSDRDRVEKMVDALLRQDSRYKPDRELGEANLFEALKKLKNTSEDFRNAIDSIRPGRHYFDDILFDWKRQRLFDKTDSPNLLKEFDFLLNLCKQMKIEFGLRIEINKSKDKLNPQATINFTYELLHGTLSIYEVKNQTIKCITPIPEQRGEEWVRRYKNGYIFRNELQIDDLNSPLFKSGNVLTDAFTGLSPIFPTVVKYTNNDGNKTFLVSIPKQLDVTTFRELYLTPLWELYRDFYGMTRKAYKGRSKEKIHRLTLMREIWEEKDLDRKQLSANQKSIILADEISKRHNVSLEPISITRWYLPSLKKTKKRDKNRKQLMQDKK